MKHLTTITCLLTLLPAAPFASEVAREAVRPAVADRQDLQMPDAVQLTGWMGMRIMANESNRLANLEPARLLEGYRKRPGRQAWDGEHVGKWLHAATLAWVNSGDIRLREKLDYVAAELCKCQQPDGYLGTYLDKDRWTEWDVWAHKYNLIGLVTYMRFTGNTTPLRTCRGMADLLCQTFGDEPGKRDILKAGYHVGLAPTSVLEPMVLLYRLTGEPRYLSFCRYILRAWEQPDGPKVISSLLSLGRVDKVGNGKAYEMLSCLNGALEYYRTVGEPRILQACLNAWQDIVEKRLYITGAASYGELFHGDYDLPNVANVGETCVTVTWLQFNAQLLRLTGEARFAEQLELVVLNQLFGAQQCDGSAWGYYVQMEGKKPYSSTLDGHCCLSSGPRGVALIPTFAVTTDAEGVVVNLYDSGEANLRLHDQTQVRLVTDTLYPGEEKIRLVLGPARPTSFSLKLRIPQWCDESTVQLNGQALKLQRGADGYAVIKRTWKKGDAVALEFKMRARLVRGNHRNAGKAALLYGPLVLAMDSGLLGEAEFGVARLQLRAYALPSADLAALNIVPAPAPAEFRTWPGARVFRTEAVTRFATDSAPASTPQRIRLIPFADAGEFGTDYKVWLPVARPSGDRNVLLDARESRSRKGNLEGSITDGDPESAVVTFDGKESPEDWFAVTLEQPVSIRQVVFFHGKTFHDGGWFATAEGKPRVEVQTERNGPWTCVGQLADYPDTTSTDPATLKGAESFHCNLRAPAKVWAVRVIGKPAGGDNPKQAFASCAELQAYP